MNQVDATLEHKGVRLTPNRVLVARFLDACACPVSMAEIVAGIGSIDRASVFRVLMLFVQKDIVHVIDDGSAALKYELCRGVHGHTLDDMHIHFKCEDCGRIFCFESEHIPAINLPEGFTMQSANFVGKGICRDCAVRQVRRDKR